jgi:putative oxidoreductase
VGLTLALAHGWRFLPPTSATVEQVGRLGFPAPAFFAWTAGLVDLAGGLLLAAGLATRPAALAIALTLGAACLAQDDGRAKELGSLYLATSVYFLIAGAGWFSLDAFLRGAPPLPLRKSL